MTLKQRLALYLSVAFSLLFGLAVLAIYFSFSSFRIQEFSDRLEEEATSDIKLLTKSKEIDQQLLKIIDGNTVHKLYNEKTLIFDDAEKLIYSSIAEALVSYNPSDLKKLKKNHRLFRQNNEKELLGLYYESKQGNYYVLITAEDKIWQQQTSLFGLYHVACFYYWEFISLGHYVLYCGVFGQTPRCFAGANCRHYHP